MGSIYIRCVVNFGVVPLITCLNLSTLLFFIGLIGIVWNKQNFVMMLLSIELMFFSVGLNFLFLSVFTYNIIGLTLCVFYFTNIICYASWKLYAIYTDYISSCKVTSVLIGVVHQCYKITIVVFIV